MQNQLFEAALGLAKPWYVGGVDFDAAKKTLMRLVLFSPVMPLFNTLWLNFALGFPLSGVFLAWHFGRVRPFSS